MGKGTNPGDATNLRVAPGEPQSGGPPSAREAQRYNARASEARWQSAWASRKVFETPKPNGKPSDPAPAPKAGAGVSSATPAGNALGLPGPTLAPPLAP